MVDLLACPFCGDDGEKGIQQVTMMNKDRTQFNRITCRCCGAMAPELNWQQRATKPSAQEEPFGYWSKFADGSEVFHHRLPTNPDYEDMPSKSIPLYASEPQAYFDKNKANPFPECFCGRPSNKLWMGKGFCGHAHYDQHRAAILASKPTVGEV